MVIRTDDEINQLKGQLEQFQVKLNQEKMIYDSIVRIKQQYTEPEGIEKAQEKLAESEKRMKYLRLEMSQIQAKLEPDKLTPAEAEVLASATLIQSPFDYWKPTGSLTSEALDFKIAELSYKHHIEEKIKTGSIKCLEAISNLPSSPERIKETVRSANNSLAQCESKIKLLYSAITSYNSLTIERPTTGGHPEEEGEWAHSGADDGFLKPKPFIGSLNVKIKEVSKSNSDDGNSLIVTCSTDGHERFTQKLKRSEKCQLNSDGFDIELTASMPVTYFELLVRTKELHPVGIIFFKLIWIANGDTAFSLAEILAMEPDGLIDLELKYTPTFSNQAEGDSEAGPLMRHNAIQRKKKERIGHQLYSKKFYNLMKCAVCHDLLYQTAAYQCDLCKFFCHKKCSDLILTKCVSATDSDLNGSNPLADIRYNVEHTFSDLQSLMPAWCMHCGKFGRKDFLKCKECDNSCHKKCAHNIPNHCGMPTSLPELANMRLSGKSSIKITVTGCDSPQLDSISNYEFLKLLGKGNFGKVVLARHKTSGHLFAIKTIKKSVAAENNELENIEVEKEIFRIAGLEAQPFLVHLHSFFADSVNFYFVMEYIAGGDLMFHIQKRKFTLDEARFYAAQILLAIEYLHKHDIIYRDLKLDNIMLSSDGNVKLADFGLCKTGMGYEAHTSTFCGTPEFIAPEILSERSYTRAVDWWAFGVLLFELVMGQSPFNGRSESEIFKSIMAGQICFKAHVSHEAQDLIRRLLTRNPKVRFGAGPTDAAPIKKHPFFKGIDFNRLIMKLEKPPFIPIIRAPSDAANFDPMFTNESPNISLSGSIIS